MTFLKILLIMLCCLSSLNASSVPIGCNPIKISGPNLKIEVKKPVVIFMQNLLENTLWLTHPVKDSGASAGWTSQMQKENWSALILDKKSFTFNCTEARPGHEQQINCEGAIMACIWKKATIPNEKKGSFWIAEDKSLHELKAAVFASGFSLGNLNK